MSAIMDAYDALCSEHEKQAALIDMLKQAFHAGPVEENLIVVYTALLDERCAKARSAGDALYEIAIEHERRRGVRT